MFYTCFASGSRAFLDWLRETLFGLMKIRGHITTMGKHGYCYQLKYAKRESLRLLKRTYYSRSVICLIRKRLKLERALAIVGERL